MTEPKNLLEWAYHWEDATPDRVWLTQPIGGDEQLTKHYTFKQGMDEARRMATYLKNLGLPERSQIGICSKNCAHWVIADLAIWMAGHVSVPVFPVITVDTFRHIIEHSEAKLLFVGKLDPIWEEMKQGAPEDLPKIAFPLAPPNEYPKWDDIIAANEPLKEPVDRSPEEMATIIYTSGSTGSPKGVMHNFATMLQTSIGINKILGCNQEDRYLSYLPISHGMERWLGECIQLYIGSHIFYAHGLDTFLQDMRRARPTLFLSVPRLWLKFQLGIFEKLPPKKLNLLLKIPFLNKFVRQKILVELGLDQTRIAGAGSAPMPKKLIEWYRGLGLELLEGYGMTENFNYSHISKPGQVRPGYVGSPHYGVDCKLSEYGEVLIKGPGNMMGYYKAPEETKACFTEDGYLHTGDRGEVDELERLKLTGRTKEIFKTSKGKYVSPAPIENKLVNHPRIELCCVCGAGLPQPHALVQLSAQSRTESAQGNRDQVAKELEDFLKTVNAGLDPNERLQFLSIVDEEWSSENGFLTPTMKIKRSVIEDAYGSSTDEWYKAGESIVWQN